MAVVAFVGADALRFAPEPEGLEVYCWPNKTATNPDGVRSLVNAHAKVYFVDRLHMKAYWSSKGGCLIGSPNLSTNALDEDVSGLHEIGWYCEDSTLLDIDALVQRLHKAGARLVDEAALVDLERAYEPPARNAAKARSRGQAFNAYLMAPVPKPFVHVYWASADKNSASEITAARDFYEEATGRTPRSKNVIDDSILVSHNTKRGTWLLACKVRRDNSLGKLLWIYAHQVVKARSNAIYSTALQLRGLYVPEPPFDISSDDFEERFRQYAEHEMGVEFEQRFDAKAFKRFESSPKKSRT